MDRNTRTLTVFIPVTGAITFSKWNILLNLETKKTLLIALAEFFVSQNFRPAENFILPHGFILQMLIKLPKPGLRSANFRLFLPVLLSPAPEHILP